MRADSMTSWLGSAGFMPHGHGCLWTLTSSSEEGVRALSYGSGANAYLVKPVSFEGFFSTINRIKGYWLTLNVAVVPYGDACMKEEEA